MWRQLLLRIMKRVYSNNNNPFFTNTGTIVNNGLIQNTGTIGPNPIT